MRLAGTFAGHKSGVFKPEDGDGEVYPYAFGKINDEDGDGGWVKVKPQSSDSDDLAEFQGVLAKLSKGEKISWIVNVDRYGNVRFVEEAA